MVIQLLRKLLRSLLQRLTSNESNPDPDPNPKRITSRIPRYKKYKIGVGTYGEPEVLDWGDGTTLEIGSYCSIADQVTILVGGEHHSQHISTYPLNSMDELPKRNVPSGA